eukprot:8651010-Alexandrium_andersonii.AAC.1
MERPSVHEGFAFGEVVSAKTLGMVVDDKVIEGGAWRRMQQPYVHEGSVFGEIVSATPLLAQEVEDPL